MSEEARYFLGIDTSNYTTSLAIADVGGNIVVNEKQLLSVAEGQRGLRQSDALFAHTVNLPALSEAIRGYSFTAVGYSATPRDEDGSYMPCFLAGKAAASMASAVGACECYPFSHQAGHIRAALYSAEAEEIMKAPFLAFHVSGGTTELLHCTPTEQADKPFFIKKIGETLDLNAGQLIDRSGVLLGLQFPCGPALETLAGRAGAAIRPNVCVKGLDCNLSGAENQVQKLIAAGTDPAATAAYVIEFVLMTIEQMTENALTQYPGLPVLYAGGVMSNRRIKERLSKRYQGYFAEPRFSSDNAAGIALLCRERWLATQQ